MKSLSLCLILVLSLTVHRGLCASARRHNEVADPADHLASPDVVESHLEEVFHRTKRFSHLSICRFCCNCCKNKECGLCCKT
ncbi:hepcidin-like [Hyla sarda]|uniref:hepcidin-like n=1 Tax=Hyla sarda TaxID=327740 RepID=UPI0024C3D2BA|nr:hepcidin-like [Hyla sarda]